MITGKDKERVRILEAKLDMAKNRFEKLADDLKTICLALDNEGVNVVGDPYWMLAYDYGACLELANQLCKG